MTADTQAIKVPSKGRARAHLGQQKLAPVNMRKDATQFVIDAFFIDEVLSLIPDGINIIQAEIWLYKRDVDNRLMIPNVLKALGVIYMRESGMVKSTKLIFDETTKEQIKRNVQKVATALDMPYSKAYFKSIVLSNADGAGKFEHTTKEIRPDDTDLRKKLRVMGLTSGQGKVQALVAAINAKKFRCTVKQEAVRIVMCSRD